MTIFYLFRFLSGDSDDATDLRCANRTLAQLRSMDNHMATLMQHQRNNATFSLPSPTGGSASHQGATTTMHLAPPTSHHNSPHSHLGYHNTLMNFQQQHQQHFQATSNHHHHHPHHVLTYNNNSPSEQRDEFNGVGGNRISPSSMATSNDYLNSMHQMVEANNLTQLHQTSSDLNSHTMTPQTTPPTPPSLNPTAGVYHSHQQHLAALAAHAQAQHEQKFAKSSASVSSSSSSSVAAATAVSSATAAAAVMVASTMANQMSAAAAASSFYSANGGVSNLSHSLHDYDERSMSSLSNGGEIDADITDDEEPHDPNDSHNIDVTSSPQSPHMAMHNFGNGSGLKRKSSVSNYCDDLNSLNNNNNNNTTDAEGFSKSIMNGNCGSGSGSEGYSMKSQFDGSVRARSLEDMQHQSFGINGNSGMDQQNNGSSHLSSSQQQQQKHLEDYGRMGAIGSGGGACSMNGSNNDQPDRLNDNDSLMNGSCASSEDLNQTNSSEQGEKITSGSDDEGKCVGMGNNGPYNYSL